MTGQKTLDKWPGPPGIHAIAHQLGIPASTLASLRAGTHRLVAVEILDRFPEINPSNYSHDEACALNSWGVEVVLAAAPGDKP